MPKLKKGNMANAEHKKKAYSSQEIKIPVQQYNHLDQTEPVQQYNRLDQTEPVQQYNQLDQTEPVQQYNHLDQTVTQADVDKESPQLCTQIFKNFSLKNVEMHNPRFSQIQSEVDLDISQMHEENFKNFLIIKKEVDDQRFSPTDSFTEPSKMQTENFNVIKTEILDQGFSQTDAENITEPSQMQIENWENYFITKNEFDDERFEPTPTDSVAESSQVQTERSCNFRYDHSYSEPSDSVSNFDDEHSETDTQVWEFNDPCSSDPKEKLYNKENISVIHEAEEVSVNTFEFRHFITEFKEKFERADFAVMIGEIDLLLLKLYTHLKAPSVQLSVCVTKDFVCELYVHGKKIEKTHPVWEGLPLLFDRVETVNILCDRLQKFRVCPGNFGESLSKVVQRKNSVMHPSEIYTEGDFKALHPSGQQYSSTVRSINCEFLTMAILKCTCCQRLGKTLRERMLCQGKIYDPTVVYCHTKIKKSEEEPKQKLAEQREEIRRLHDQIRMVTRNFDRKILMQEVEVNKYKNLLNWMGNSSGKKHIFWEQQLKNSQVSNPMRTRWHPKIIEWCANIRQTSPKAYEVLKNAGFISLPSTHTILSHSKNKTKILPLEGEEPAIVLKEEGFDFWKNTLNSCRYVVAPMVDQSELAWRMLSRRYAAELCFTPMLHSSVFAKDPHYRRESLQSCEGDRPLIVQFCGNDPDTVLAAAKLAENHCDAIDLNLGCPQMIARRGHYGAYLQDEWELLEKIVSTCHANLKVPITCKIRVFESVEKTVEYAKMLEKAGCQLLTVHSRTREMKGRLTGLANWEYVKAIKKAVNIPVFSNGNIQYLSDVERCLKETGVDGVMTAEGNLHNPALFAGINPPIWQMCEEYLELTKKYPCPLSYIRGHVFKILHHGLHLHPDVRDMVGVAKSPECLKKAVQVLKERCLKEMADDNFDPRDGLFGKLPLPYWYCQPYERPSPEQEEQNRQKRELLTRPATIEVLVLEKGMSKKKVKKRLRNPNKNFDAKKKVKFEICADIQCNNPRGQKCNFNMCKGCCRKKTSTEVVDCIGHKIHFTTHPVVQQRNKENASLIEKNTQDTNKEHSGGNSSGSNNTSADSGVYKDLETCSPGTRCDAITSMETAT